MVCLKGSVSIVCAYNTLCRLLCGRITKETKIVFRSSSAHILLIVQVFFFVLAAASYLGSCSMKGKRR